MYKINVNQLLQAIMIGVFHLLLIFLNTLRMVSGIEQQVYKSDFDGKSNILSGKELKAVVIMVRSY